MEVINKQPAPVQEQAVSSPATTTSADVSATTTVAATSTEPVAIAATTTAAEPVPAADVRFLETEIRLQAETVADGVKLTWTPLTDGKAEGYKIVRSSSDPLPWFPKSGAIAFVATGTDTTYLDRGVAKGEAYWYRVCAIVTDAPPACGNVMKIEMP